MAFEHKKSTNSLRNKLIFPFIAGTIGLTFFLVAYTYYSAYKVVADTALILSKTETESTVNTMTMLIKSLLSQAQDLVTNPDIIRSLKKNDEAPPLSIQAQKQISRRLMTITESYRYFRDILLLDKNAHCISSSNGGYLGVDFSDEEYARQAITGHYFLGNFSVGKVSKTFRAYFSAPIDIDGKFSGILVIISDCPKLVQYKTYDAPVIGALSTSILAPEGIYMAHKDKSVLGDKNHTYKETYQQLLVSGKKGGEIRYSHNGEQYTGYAKLEPNTRWLIITSGLTRKVFATAYRTGLVVFIIGITFLCIVSILVIRYATNIMNSLLSLVSYAEQVSKGDLDLQLKMTNRTDELGTLHHTLEYLVASLKQSLREKDRANNMKDEFLANMSHEIRTPLNAIIGMTYLAEKKDLKPEKQALYLKRIKIAAQSLLGIINDILDISKIEAGKMTIEATPFELREMVEDTMAIHQESAKTGNITFSFEYKETLPRYFMGDVLRIRQILNNLLSNAIKFTQQGSIRISCWEQYNNEGQCRLYFSVSDTGAGIEKEAIPYLFNPFIQADTSVTRKFGGTGLGLAICRNLILLMKGNIWVDSEIGSGSTFTFYLPLPTVSENAVQETTNTSQTAAAVENKHTKGKRILLAEDNSINQVVFKELLAPLKTEIVAVTDGKQAVDAFQKGIFDLVLMDMQMPEMGGMEATRKIRNLEKERRCPIIALTANARTKDKVEALAAGMDDYITKPIDPPTFEKVIRQWLSRQV